MSEIEQKDLNHKQDAEWLDQARSIREGESLDEAKIDAYLKSHISGLTGTPVFSQFPGGASNLTYLVRYPDRDLVLRRPPFGRIAKSAHNMLREARVMQALKPVYPYVPDILVSCDDAGIMGCDFYVMSRIKGIIPRQNMPEGLELDESQIRQLCINAIDQLVKLHKVDIHAAGLENLAKGEGYVARQISGWSDRYRQAMTEDATDFESVMAWLDAHQPAQVANCLIHNDYRFDNLVLDPEDPLKIIGVLDWEMATLGDPLMDLGNSLAYWIEADDEPAFQMMRRQPTHLKGMLTRQEVIDYYLAETGFPVTNFVFYEIYGLFRLAAIIQQIYYRYFHGQTKDKRFAGFVHAAKYLEQRCLRIIAEQGEK